MMRICLISNMYPSPKEVGYGVFVRNIAEGVQTVAPGVKMDFAVIRGSGHSLGVKLWKYLCFYFRIAYCLAFFKYDIVYVHYITHATPVIRLISVFKRLPLVYHVHGRDLITQSALSGYLLKISIPLLLKAKLIVLPSHFFKRKIKELIPEIEERRLFVSPSGGVNTDVFYDRNSHGKYIGYVSRVEANKGIDTFLNALLLLKAKGYVIHGLVVGGGVDREKFLEQIHQMGLGEEVDYIGGVGQEELAKYYNLMDVFVFPTKFEESLGLVGLEAMACGTPVIGSRLGGLTDYIVEGENGFFFKAGDAVALADVLVKYLNLPEMEKSTLRQNAVLTANEYSNKKVIKQLYDRFLAL